MSDSRDFFVSSPPPSHPEADGLRNTADHHSDDRERDIEAQAQTPKATTNAPTRHSFVSENDIHRTPTNPILRRRGARSSTSRTVTASKSYPERPNWHPGQEPGLDPSKPNGGRTQKPMLHAQCEITVVDFSEDDMVMRHLNNESLPGFLKHEKEDWIKCRWINVNGLSWDVISALGKYKKLHRLAVEDMTNTRNRTKADW